MGHLTDILGDTNIIDGLRKHHQRDPGTRACEEVRELGAACAELAEQADGGDRVRQYGARTAARCHAGGAVIAADLSLATEPPWTARLREVNLFCELVRQLRSMLRATKKNSRTWQPTYDDFDELDRRIGTLAEQIPVTAPWPDHTSEPGSQALSLARLADHSREIRQAAAAVRGTLTYAAALPHPTPVAAALHQIADQLDQHASTREGHLERTGQTCTQSADDIRDAR